MAYRFAASSSAAADALHPHGPSVRTSSTIQCELRDYPRGIGGDNDRAVATLLFASGGGRKKGRPAAIFHDPEPRADWPYQLPGHRFLPPWVYVFHALSARPPRH